MKLVRTVINDQEWHIYLVSAADMTVLKDDSDDPAATTDFDTFEMHVIDSELTYRIVAHEINHIYLHSLFLWDTRMSWDEYEEILSNFYAYRGKEIGRKCDIVYEALVSIKDSPREEEDIRV